MYGYRAGKGSEALAGSGGVVVATTELEWTTSPPEAALTVVLLTPGVLHLLLLHLLLL